jgi:acyl-CoA thioesterase YciA
MNQDKEFCYERGKELICSKLCKTSDLGVSGNVFGGRILEWLDEAGGIFAVKKIGGAVVTIKVSEVLFKVPVHERDIIDIVGFVKAIGTTSISLELDAINITTEQTVCTCEIKFVHVNEKGDKLPIPNERREIIKKFYGLI